MTFNDTVLGIIVGGFGTAVVLHAGGFPEMAGMEYGPEFFPTLIGAAFIIIGATLVVSSFVKSAAERGPLVALPAWARDPIAVLRAAGVLAAVVAFALLSPIAGFLLTTIAITAGLLVLMGAGWRVVIPMSMALPLVLYYVFSTTLRVPLPRGPLERLFF